MISGFMDSFRDDPDLFVTLFGEYVVGAQPADWTAQFGTGMTAAVQSVAGSLSGKVLRLTKTLSNRVGFSWNKIPTVANVEILTRLRATEGWTAGEGIIANFARGSGGAGTENGYRHVVSVFNTGGTLYQSSNASYVNGTGVVVGPQVQGPAPNLLVNDWVWCRSRFIGNTQLGRIWHFGATEPGTWDISNADTAVPGAGWTGIMNTTSNPDAEVDFFGVAINGKTVPLLIP